MLPIVARSANGSLPTPGPKNSTNLPTTPFLRSIWVTVSTRSVAVEPSGSAPVSLKPTTSGISIDTGWPEHRGLGLDAADAPAQHGQAVDHGGVAVGADQRVGVGHLLVAFLRGPDDLRQVFQIDLVADAGARRHDAEIVEALGAPAQERVALGVAVILELDIAGERGAGAERIDLDRMVDHQVHRHQRVDLPADRRPAPPWRRAWPRGRPRPARR